MHCRAGIGLAEERVLRERLDAFRRFGCWRDYRDRFIAFFGAADKALRWLEKPKQRFGGLSPRDLYDAGRIIELEQLLICAEEGYW